MVSIMPGMESRAPERTETRSGFSRSPKFLAEDFLGVGDAGLDLRPQFLGIGFFVGVIVSADFGGDGEAGRNGQADAGHFRQVGAFAAEQGLHGAVAVRFFVAEKINVFLCFVCSRHTQFRLKFVAHFNKRGN